MGNQKMNIVYIYADDLGRGMLSCYGQKYFKTPNIDRLAKEGVRFESAYGCAVSAPARASLITGYHDCHAGKWSYCNGGLYKELATKEKSYEEIRELLNNSSYNERPDEMFLAHIAKKAGLVTGEIGKLEWGFSATPEQLDSHGWDYHCGYYDHVQCHGFYPPFLFENGEVFTIEGNTHADCGKSYLGETPENRQEFANRGGMTTYSQDIFNQKIVDFITKHKDEAFFLYHPSQLPHGPTAVPELHQGVKDVAELSLYEKEYASMVLRLDDCVGLIYKTLEDLGILDNTMIIFSSDNGHTSSYYIEEGRCSGESHTGDGRLVNDVDVIYDSTLCGDIFNGNDSMSGCKKNSLEGGVKIPFIVRHPHSKVTNSVSGHLLANYDTMATIADLLGVDYPSWKDGESFLSSTLGVDLPQDRYVVFAGTAGPALVASDGWKVRYINHLRQFQLYYLPDDYQEKNNLIEQNPEKLKELATLLVKECDGNMYHGTMDNHVSMNVEEYLNGSGPENCWPAILRYKSSVQ